ncbi:MAG: transcriptional repressor, partial [Gammaproteobacteria bacterium]|nr:transcriptional repressor [Gammaproteobacteria bacterium]
MNHRENMINKLKSSGVTPTTQRVEIAQILFARPQHLSAEQILKMVNESSSTASKATVYNTLGLFAKKGLVKEVIVDPTKVFYDSNISKHYHFFNTD